MSEPSADRGEVACGLARLAHRLGSSSGRVENLARLSGGATQEIWRFDLVEGDERRPLILRRAASLDWTAGSHVGLAVEAGLMRAAAANGVPVPDIIHLLSPGDGLGEGFVMAFVEGETLGGRIVRSPALAPARETLAQACGAILARIGAIDPAGFPSLVRYDPAHLVDHWLVRYRGSGRARPVFELAFRWLGDHCPPPPERPRLVHGDFRNGNLMVGPEGVRAVLDWELAHLGDPMEDLGWLCVASWRFGRIGLPVGGFGDVDALKAGYESVSDMPLDWNRLHWWEVFGTLRWGVMCAGMAEAFRTADPGVERGMIARRSSETEIDLLRLLAA